MANAGICEGCNTYKHIYISVISVLSTLGGRKNRRQKSTSATKWCRSCFDSPKFSRLHVPMMREMAKAANSEARAVEWDK